MQEMGLGLSLCQDALSSEADLDYMGSCQLPKTEHSPQEAPAPQQFGPRLALRIESVLEDSLGAHPSPFGKGDEVAVALLEKVKGWGPLVLRQESSAKQRAALGDQGRLVWPDGPRFSTAQRFWGAKIISSDGKEGFEEHWCMLQVGVVPQERDLERAKLAVEDARVAASYAHRFNLQTASALGEDAEIDEDEVPRVKVYVPMVASVLGSVAPEVANQGEFITLTPYPSPDVKKFVFDGSEDFLELPQAFFHYVVWASGGREVVADIQGLQEDVGVGLVDPVVLRTSQPTVGGLLGAVVGTQASCEGGFEERFNTCHAHCGQLCRNFDPHRRGMHVRRHCGLSAPSCGVQGGA